MSLIMIAATRPFPLMTTYVDPSALLKRYVDEPDSALADRLLRSDPVVVTSWLTLVEVRRNLPRLLTGAALRDAKSSSRPISMRLRWWRSTRSMCGAAAQIGEQLGVRSLEAIHLASAQRLAVPALTFVTFDLRQAQAARSLGFTVLGS